VQHSRLFTAWTGMIKVGLHLFVQLGSYSDHCLSCTIWVGYRGGVALDHSPVLRS